MTDRPALHDYQAAGIRWLQQTKRGLLADEPGLGKSRQLIEAAEGPTLVIAPTMVIASGTWTTELQRWAADPEQFTIAPYSQLNIRERTGRCASRPTNRVKPEYLREWGTVIVDEAHYVKGRHTSWTGAVEQITQRSDRLYLATGTPIANWAHELWTLLRMLRPDQARPGHELGSYWRWVQGWFNVQPSRFNPQAREIGDLKVCNDACLGQPAHLPCEHYRQFIDANLGHHMLRRLRDDCLDLPPVTEQRVLTPLSTAGRKLYRQMKREYLAYVNGPDAEPVVAWNVGSRNDLLDQLTVSEWMLGDRTTPPRGGKFDMLRADLESRSRPTLVLAHHQAVVEACAQVARSVGASVAYVHGKVPTATAGAAIRRFTAGELDVLVGSLETVAEGMTLVAADMAIFVERSYKPYRNVQARRRIHRLGQTRPVTIREYVTPRTVDSGKTQLLETKTDRQMRMLSARDFAALL